MGKCCSNSNFMRRKSLKTFLDILVILSYFFRNSTISATSTIILLKSRMLNSLCHFEDMGTLGSMDCIFRKQEKKCSDQYKTAMKENKFSSTSL